MNSRQKRLALSLGTAAVLVAAMMVMVFLGWRRAPDIPRDMDHARSANEKECLSCHGPGQKHARDKNHPLRDDCFNCHVWAPAPPPR